jgi:pimeloyl-ACP methyl ester carboxylesterase
MTDVQSQALRTFKSDAGMAKYMTAYDAVLREWPVPYEELDLPTRFGTTHAIASGARDASSVLLLPSLAGSATLWRPNVAALSQRYRVYALDMPGQVGKSVSTRRFRTRRDLADWLSDVLDALGVRTASLIGCSYGACAALSQASLMPERVERVVLIGPAGIFVPLSWKFYFAMLVKGPILRMLRRKRPRDIADLLGKHARIAPIDARWRELMSVTMSVSAIPNTVRVGVFNDAELEAIRSPTLLLIGEHELLYEAHSTLKRAMERMPGLTGAVIPDAHHLAALAQPEDVNQRIIRFLKA